MTDNPFINTTSGLQPNAGIVGVPGAITAASTTSQTIALGTQQYQVQPQAAWAPGMFVTILSTANNANYMVGVVVSYSDTTLTVNVQSITGSGIYDSWLINLGGSGQEGPAGATGATGAAGADAGPVNGAVQGIKILNNAGTPSTKIDITAIASIMVNASGTSVRATGISVTIDLTTGTSSSAANGMDGEARGTSGWIYLYLINNGVTQAGLATKNSPLSSAPTLPSGYTYYTYVGAIYVDGSGNLLRTQQKRNRATYKVTGSSNTETLPVIGSGSAGSTASPTWAAVAIATFVPPTANVILVSANGDAGGTPATVIVAPNNSYGTADSTNPPPVAVSTANAASISELPIESTSIYWASSGDDGYLFCVGWDDYVATV